MKPLTQGSVLSTNINMPCVGDCNNHGTCMNSKCSCDLGFFPSDSSSTDCKKTGVHEWGSGWDFFIIFFGICFGIVFVFSSFKLMRSLKQERTYDCKNKCKRLFLSPKNLSLLGIIVIGLIKVIWLSFDPLVFKDKSSRLVDRLMFETIYPVMFTVLASVLLVWSGIHQALRKKKRDPFKFLSKIIVGLMILVYPLTWMLCINKGMRAEEESWYWIGYISLIVGSSFLSSLFIGFFALLCCYLSKDNRKEDKNKSKESNEKFFKATRENIDRTDEVEAKETRLKTSPQRIGQNFEKFENRRKGGSLDWFEYESNDAINQSKEMEEVFEGKPQEIEREEIVAGRIENYLYDLSKDEKKLVRKLLLMTCISGISGLLIIAVGTPFTLSNSLSNPNLTFFGIFFAFFLELCICILIILAFTTQINKQEKKNIKQMVYLARKNRSKSPQIELAPEFKHISRRLELYYL